MGQMLNRKQLDEAAEQYADACNSAWTNDYDGFIAGAYFVLQKLQQTYVSGSLPLTIKGLDVEALANTLYEKWSVIIDDRCMMPRDLFTLAIQDIVRGGNNR